mgnify:CR=1 FL=1
MDASIVCGKYKLMPLSFSKLLLFFLFVFVISSLKYIVYLFILCISNPEWEGAWEISFHIFSSHVQVMNCYPDVSHSVISPMLLCLIMSPFVSITFGSLHFVNNDINKGIHCEDDKMV